MAKRKRQWKLTTGRRHMTAEQGAEALELYRAGGGTPRLCGNCDHFEVPSAPGKKGSCHNLISGTMFVRAVDKACPNGFYPDTVRFPIHVLMGIVPAKEK